MICELCNTSRYGVGVLANQLRISARNGVRICFWGLVFIKQKSSQFVLEWWSWRNLKQIDSLTCFAYVKIALRLLRREILGRLDFFVDYLIWKGFYELRVFIRSLKSFGRVGCPECAFLIANQIFMILCRASFLRFPSWVSKRLFSRVSDRIFWWIFKKLIV